MPNPTSHNSTGAQGTINNNCVKAEAEALGDEFRSLHNGYIRELGTIDGRAVSVVELPEGRALHSVKRYLDEYRAKPERRRGTARFDDQDSFIAHVNRFKNENTAIFAKCESGIDDGEPSATVTAILDYHAPNDTSFRDHVAMYECPISAEWKAWAGPNGVKMTMREFARHLEDNILDIGEPTRALPKTNDIATRLDIEFAAANRLMGVAKTLTIKGDVTVTNAVNLQSGEGVLHFEEKHLDATGQPLKVPAAFFVEIPVLTGGRRWQLPARLRYERTGGAMHFWYDLYRTDLTWDAAIEQVLADVREQTLLPVWRGSPET